MLLKTGQAVTILIQEHFKDLVDPELNNLDKVPAILWKVADAASKFFEDNTIAASLESVDENTVHLYNTNIVQYVARKFSTVRRSWEDRGKDTNLAAGCNTYTAVQVFLANELIPQQVTRKAAAEK